MPAQLDNAADRTVLPEAAVKSLGLPQEGQMNFGGLGGITYSLAVYVVLLAFTTGRPGPSRWRPTQANRGCC